MGCRLPKLRREGEERSPGKIFSTSDGHRWRPRWAWPTLTTSWTSCWGKKVRIRTDTHTLF
ncbi:unnamed protein product [Oncorhynchus mykiss]|uniref:Uncharacterized protein n=1 Tax=Oncorhynchus mykiss TaxID=8022 RepID=A0A060ZCF1_ONCMY|nr:unnamed protein product [Oncorhynchus mykiss]